MTIALPDNKFHAYSIAFSEMLKRGWTSKGELETNIGRWVHLGKIIPTVHHFLSRLHILKQRAENRRQITINEQCKEDLHFLLFILGKCHQGIDLNLIAFQQPSHVYRSNSCPARLGGYSHEDFAWRFYLPDKLQFRTSNNLLEHLTAIITPWIDIRCWSTQKRRLRTFNDRQHNLRRLAEEIEFHQGRRRSHPSHHPDRSSMPSCNTLPLERN